MRRLLVGLLAAALLLTAGCGPGGNEDTTAHEADQVPVETPTLAASTRAIEAARPDEGTLDVVVTAPVDVSAPGLDAAVSVLLERPELRVVVVAPATDGTGSGRIASGHTMSGFPAHVVDAAAADVLAVAMGALHLEPDLAVIGFVEGAALGTGVAGTEVAAQLRAAADLEIPALAVTTGIEHGVDLAGTGAMLRSLLDTELDALVRPGARLLTVPSCDEAPVRGPVEVERSLSDTPPADIDCRGAALDGPVDDVTAHGRGHATVVELDPLP